MLELFTKKTKKVIGIAALTCFLATPISYTMSVSSAAAAALDNQIQFDQRHEPRHDRTSAMNLVMTVIMTVGIKIKNALQKMTAGIKIRTLLHVMTVTKTVGTKIKKIHHHLLHVTTATKTVGTEMMTKTTIKAISLQLY